MTVASLPKGRLALLRERLRRLPHELLRRPTLMLLSSTVAAQAIALCAAPLLTRLYTPDQFGILGAIGALVMIVVPLATGRYELAIPRARSDAEAYALLRVCLAAIGLGVVVSALAAGAAAHAGPARVVGLLRGHWVVVPLAIGCVALYDTLAMEASRRNRLRPLAASKLSQQVGGVGAQLALGWAGWGTPGLLIGYLFNQALGVGTLWRALVSGHPGRDGVGWRQLRVAAFEHRRYPLYASWTSALEGCAKGLLPLAFALLWGPQIAGFVFLTDRLVGRPLQLLSTSLLPVYVADLSRALKENPADALVSFHRSLGRQCALAVTWTIAVVALAPWVVGPLFGVTWADAVPYVQAMTLAIAPLASLHAVAHTLQITGHQRLDALLVVGKVLVILAVLLGGHLAALSALDTLRLFAVAQLLLAALVFLSYRGVLRRLAAPSIEERTT